jgi:transposase
MQYALIQVLPDVPPGGVCAGIDWASTDHVACVVDMAGRVVDQFSAAHDRAGIAAMIARLRRAGAGEVAIERGDGPLVRRAAGRGPDGGRDHVPPGEEPAVAVQRGRRQG